jgi:hypothetical protein
MTVILKREPTELIHSEYSSTYTMARIIPRSPRIRSAGWLRVPRVTFPSNGQGSDP